MNYADSEKIHRILLQAGILKVLDPTEADIVILNTCSVRQKGEDKVFGFIESIAKSDLSKETNTLIGVTGCMVRKSGIAKRYIGETLERKRTRKIVRVSDSAGLANYDDDLLSRSSNIDFVFRIEETGSLTKILTLILGRDIGNDEKWEEYLKIRQTQENPTSANVIIQTGCDNYCTFCIVPETRGREVSRSIDDIVQEAREVVERGTKEITLLGQNVNSYGKEARTKLWNSESLTWSNSGVKTPFRELLDELGAVMGIDRIRFTSSNPHDMTRDILESHFEIPALCPYLHFALQSGSDEVLKKMNRKHTYADFKAQVEYLRGRDPFFSISTDIIVGFPGESETDFELTAQAMIECEFDFVYLARYSPRPGTFAGDRLEDSVSPAEKARRWNVLNEILTQSARSRNERMIGRTEEILITGVDREGRLVGRTRNFKEVSFEGDSNLRGIVRVEIDRMEGWGLGGVLIS